MDGKHHVLLPVPLEKPGTKKLAVLCGKKTTTFDIAVKAGNYPESKLSVDPKFSKPPPPRVVQEKAAIEAAMKTSAPERTWTAAFAAPGDAEETSPFGVRRTYNGKTQSRHQGLDLEAKEGDPVRAANDGVVVLAADDFFYTGNAVFIDHGDGLFTMYFHFSKLAVKTGDHT